MTTCFSLADTFMSPESPYVCAGYLETPLDSSRGCLPSHTYSLLCTMHRLSYLLPSCKHNADATKISTTPRKGSRVSKDHKCATKTSALRSLLSGCCPHQAAHNVGSTAGCSITGCFSITCSPVCPGVCSDKCSQAEIKGPYFVLTSSLCNPSIIGSLP